MEAHLPPVTLVETWLDLVRNDTFKEAKERADSNIRLFFGDVAHAEIYIVKQKFRHRKHRVA
mgnify:CR=1 FL=1